MDDGRVSPFQRLKRDVFYSNGWCMRSIRFSRDQESEVTGFTAGNVGTAGIRFVKVTASEVSEPTYDACQQVQQPAKG